MLETTTSQGQAASLLPGGHLQSFSAARMIAGLSLLLCAAGAHAQSRFEQDFDDTDKSWEEVGVQLPAAPRLENLTRVDSSATQEFSIDTASLSVGADGVVRYTLVAQSSGGARNVSYEGIRCATHEKKLYAFGQGDGSWSRSRRDQWERIRQNQANRQHSTLATDYFCDQLAIAGDAEQIVKRLHAQRPRRVELYR